MMNDMKIKTRLVTLLLTLLVFELVIAGVNYYAIKQYGECTQLCL